MKIINTSKIKIIKIHLLINSIMINKNNKKLSINYYKKINKSIN